MPPSGVVDMPSGVVGGGRGAGGRGTTRDVVVVKGSGNDVAMSTLGRSRRVPSSAIAEIEENWAYWAHFCVDFDYPNINLKGLLCIF